MEKIERSVAFALAALLEGCGALGLDAAYQQTRALDESITNVEVYASPFPAPRCERLPADVLDRWKPLSGEGPSPWPFVAEGAAGTIVDTDIDDTLIASLWDRERYPRKTLYPGVVALLAAEGAGSPPGALVALTARPSPEPTRRDLCAWLHPPSDEACQDIGVSTGELDSVVDSLGMGLVKAEALLEQRRRSPRKRMVFNGDSGQGDWIAALIVRDLHPGASGFYAAIHDVRAWSPEHREELHELLQDSERLFRIYRRNLPRREDEPASAHDARLTFRLRRIRDRIDAAPTGPHGRLDGRLLREQRIFLHRSYPALALDLAEAKLISDDAADRVLVDALPALCFAPAGNASGFDGVEERVRLIERLVARAAERRAGPR
jgi:hypothetical protein